MEPRQCRCLWLTRISTKDELTEFLSIKNIVSCWNGRKGCYCCKPINGKCNTFYYRVFIKFTRGVRHKNYPACLQCQRKYFNVSSTLFIAAQETDVLVFVVRRYLRIPPKSYVIPKSNELIFVNNIFMSLGPSETAALPVFQAISGCDCT